MSLDVAADALQKALFRCGYVAERPLATAVFLAKSLQRPLLLEGVPGIGKTALAHALAMSENRPLIRLQCHMGMDYAQGIGEWNYPKQMLWTRFLEKENKSASELESLLFTPDFFIKRPLMQALDASSSTKSPVLLIDEVDRADESFEAVLLEFLAEYQVTVPEMGTFSAKHKPLVVLTSNQTREVHDALRRRCLYAWLDYPDVETEKKILLQSGVKVSLQVVDDMLRWVDAIRRDMGLYKPPGTSELIDWARALESLQVKHLDVNAVGMTLGVLVKYQDDMDKCTLDALTQLMASKKSLQQE